MQKKSNTPFYCSTAIGLRVKDGVVLAVEKLVQSKLLVAGANRRIQSADLHIGIVSKVIILITNTYTNHPKTK